MKKANVFLAAVVLVFRVHGMHCLQKVCVCVGVPREQYSLWTETRTKKNKANGKQRCDTCYKSEKEIEHTIARQNAAMVTKRK